MGNVSKRWEQEPFLSRCEKMEVFIFSKRAVRNFREGLDKLEGRSREVDLVGKMRKTSRLQMFHTIASHTSYHTGQVVMLRQLLGKWPPPSGGLTW